MKIEVITIAGQSSRQVVIHAVVKDVVVMGTMAMVWNGPRAQVLVVSRTMDVIHAGEVKHVMIQKT